MIKQDYKNEILPEGMTYRTYNVVGEDGIPIHQNVHFEKAYIPLQVGDNFGAQQINEMAETVNKVNTYTKEEIDAKVDAKAPMYSYGTDDLEAGVSPLETGKLHFVYE